MKIASISIITGFALIAFLLVSFTTPVGDKSPWEIPEKFKKMDNPYKGDKGLERVGRILYAKHCKSCHGSRGHGDGPKAKQIEVEIFDFSTEEFQSNYSDGEIYYMSIIGRDEMPNFEKKLTDDEDRWAVVNYIRSLGK